MTAKLDPPEGYTLAEIHEEIRGLDKTIASIGEINPDASHDKSVMHFVWVVRDALVHAYGEPEDQA